jgi:type I restriction enzyme S subunit
MSICATLGKPILVDMAACIHDGFVKFYDLKDVDTEYLYYALLNIEQFIQGSGQAGTQKNLNTGIVENYELFFPKTKKEQTKIAQILSSIDKSIEKTESLIAKYQRIKTGLMHDLLTKGIDKNGIIRNEKSYKFKAINRLKVPKEWDIKQIISTTYLKAWIGWQGLKAIEFIEDGPYLVTGTDFKDGEINWDTCYHVSEERYREAEYIHLQNGDLVITKDGTIGKTAIIKNCPMKAVLNSGVFVLRCNDGSYLNEFLYYILNSNYFFDFLFQTQGGSTINHLYQREFEKFFFPCPSINEQRKILSVLVKINENHKNEQNKLSKLIAIKNGVMQDLLTGKVKLNT